MKMIDAKEFEKDVQDILTQLNVTGGSLTIMRDGRPVAELRGVAVSSGSRPSMFGLLANPAYRFDNPFDPAIDPEDWDAVRGEWKPRD